MESESGLTKYRSNTLPDGLDYLGALEMLDEQAVVRDDFVALAQARCAAYLLAEDERNKLWVFQAEQIHRLRNDVRAGRPLWKWCGGAEDWEMFCWEELGIGKDRARLLERSWQTYRLRLDYPVERIAEQGKQKSIYALAPVNEDLDAKGELDDDLEDILLDGTNREMLDYIRERKGNPGLNRQPLQWKSDGTVTFWDSENLGHRFAVGLDKVTLLAPPNGLATEDRMLWNRKQKEYMKLMGGEDES